MSDGKDIGDGISKNGKQKKRINTNAKRNVADGSGI
ncbi:hypothetical protein QG37_05889 [Candidozyma auris]|uniref:Uncharacterized protein n=1 Tax=Candidozyma auris TaxID=498019 RepID=A0A0L0NU22_CANAR|nr:hypothetical protein QG37_05889 [[Candida] auris]